MKNLNNPFYEMREIVLSSVENESKELMIDSVCKVDSLILSIRSGGSMFDKYTDDFICRLSVIDSMLKISVSHLYLQDEKTVLGFCHALVLLLDFTGDFLKGECDE